LGVSAQTASRWYRSWQAGGRDALVGAERLGRTPRLSDGQLAQVQAALVAGPKAHGFATDMWTLARVAQVIEQVTGVRYSPSQTWLILRQRLGWTRQRPARRAVERDDEAIEQWVKRDGRGSKGGSTTRRVDLLPGRERVLPAARREGHLGSTRSDAGVAPPVLLVAYVHGRCAGLPARP